MSDEQPESTRPHVQVPSHLFRGRVRTSTFAMCVLWLGLWVGYLILNQPDDTSGAPQQAVMISDTPYVPYQPPSGGNSANSDPGSADSPTPTGTPTTSPTSGAPETAVPRAPVSGTPPTTATTTGVLPFELPEIPGLPGFDGGTDSETGEDSGRTGESGP